MNSTKLFITIIIVFLVQLTIYAQPKLEKDLKSQNIAYQALAEIYNFKFTTAKNTIAKLKTKYSKHPVYPFLQSYLVSWRNMPLTKQKADFALYEKYLLRSVSYSEAILKKRAGDLEATFFLMMVYGLLAQHESESGSTLKSVSYGRKALKYIKKGFNLTNKYPEFHFSTGLYRYYAVQYPQTHSWAKVFMKFFPSGDKKDGLWHLNRAVWKSRFASVESLIFLNAIYAKYEVDYLKALNTSQQLIQKYPNNPFFWVLYCEDLILVGRYAEAEIYLKKFNSRTGKVYKIADLTFKGLIQEKYYKNLAKAKSHYKKVLTYTNYDQRYSNDYVAFSNAGLGRIYKSEKKPQTAKKYFKTAEKMTEYEGLKKEMKKAQK